MNRTDVLTDREDYYLEQVRHFGPEYQNFDLSVSELAINISFTYEVLHQCTSRYMADFGLSKSTFTVLILLRHGPPEGMQFHDLGELLLVSRANITGLISHLEEKGLVTRVVDEHDRRARFAKVTPKAEALLDEFVPVHFKNLGCVMEKLSAQEKSLLVSLLAKVRQSIKKNSIAGDRLVETEV